MAALSHAFLLAALCFVACTTNTSAFLSANTFAMRASRLGLSEGPSRTRHASSIVMGRKGRPTGAGRPGMDRQPMRQQQQPPLPDDGSPAFYIFCRNPSGSNVWYPVTALQGDATSRATSDAIKDGKFGSDFMEARMETSIAKAVFAKERELTDTAVRANPALKKYKKDLQWGYKMLTKELMADIQSGKVQSPATKVLAKDMMEETTLDAIGKSLGNLFSV